MSYMISRTNPISKGPYLLLSIFNDKNESKNDAITEIYKVLRPGEPPTIEIANQIFQMACTITILTVWTLKTE